MNDYDLMLLHTLFLHVLFLLVFYFWTADVVVATDAYIIVSTHCL